MTAGERGDVKRPAGCRDIAEVLGQSFTGADAGRHEIVLGHLV
jgi:hypothetical protein